MRTSTAKKWLSLLLTLVMVVTAAPLAGFAGLELFQTASAAEIVDSGECGENVKYTLDGDGLLTISGTGEMTSSPWDSSAVLTVIIKNDVENIGDYAFAGCTGLTRMTIPDSVTSIGYRAFSDCAGLASIVVAEGNPVYHSAGNCLIETESKTLVTGCKTSKIPADGSVTSIGYEAFRDCTGLTSVTIPASVTDIGGEAFSGCAGLTSIVVAEGNPVYHSAWNCLIETESKELILGCSTSVIPADGGVTSIGYEAFRDCTGLTSVTIPDSVTSIGYEAFSGCTGLTSVTIPDSVTSIGYEAFSGCTGLTSVTIPDSVTSIGYEAFSGCTGLTSVTIPDSVTSIGYRAFSDCVGLASIVVAEGNPVYHSAGNCLIETESKELILGCSTSVIPADGSVTEIGYCAFENCTGLLSVTIPASVTSIDSSAFSGCAGLTSVTIGKGVTSIDRGAFSGCIGLDTIAVADENPVYHADGNCVIETGSKRLVFGCISSVIPADGSVTSLGDYAFYGCKTLMNLPLPDCITALGIEVFADCRDLRNVALPDSLNSIPYGTFYNCESLSAISIPNGVAEIGGDAFNSCMSLTTAAIPNNVTQIESGTFIYCENLRSVQIPDSVKSISWGAFDHCEKLSDIYYTGPEEEWKSIEIKNGNEPLLRAAVHFNASLPDHEHTWDDGTVITPPTCTEQGVKQIACPACGKTRTEPIPALGHDWAADYTIDKPATKTEAGEKSIHCTRCDERKDITAIPKIEKPDDVKIGDANGDGKIDSKDILRLCNYLQEFDYDTNTSSVSINAKAADCNGDGKIDSKDILRLCNYLQEFDYDTGTSPVKLGK